MLDALHEGELAAGRRADWLGAPVAATHVDRLFGFVLEKRLRCESCGDLAEQRSVYSTDRVLHLPVPAQEERARVDGDGVVFPALRAVHR